MKKHILLSLVLVSIFTPSFCQFRWDIGGGLGLANYLGEMGGKEQTRRDFVSDMKLNETRWAFQGFARYRFHPLVSVKGVFTYARIEGADSLSSNPGRVGRNLHFRNDLLELSFQGEFDFYQFNDVGRGYRFNKDFRAYGFVGVGALYSNPRAQYKGEWVALQPLMTEGQSKPYSLFQVVIPAGLGVSLTYHKYHRFSWELGWRTTFTDYLDDVSTVYAPTSDLPNNISVQLSNQSVTAFQNDPTLPHPNNYSPGSKRGDPTHNDSYIFSTFSYSYMIKGTSMTKKRYKKYFRKQNKWYMRDKPRRKF